MKLVDIAKKRSTFVGNIQKKIQLKKNGTDKKENKIAKLKPIENIKKVISNYDTDLETDKVH